MWCCMSVVLGTEKVEISSNSRHLSAQGVIYHFCTHTGLVFLYSGVRDSHLLQCREGSLCLPCGGDGSRQLVV